MRDEPKKVSVSFLPALASEGESELAIIDHDLGHALLKDGRSNRRISYRVRA